MAQSVVAKSATKGQNYKTMKKQLPAFSDQLRQAVTDCGLSQYAISKQTGISKSTLCRFMNGERGLTMNALDTLAAHLRLEVRMLGPIKKD